MTVVMSLSGVKMLFAHDTELALVEAAALVNTLSDGVDELATRAGLDAFLDRYQFSGTRLGTEEELASVRRLRDWHLHVTRPDAPLADRIGAEAAMGFLDLVRSDDLGRLRFCAADDCSDVLVDLSRNKSKRYCDTGNCGNRTNVAAYRARR